MIRIDRGPEPDALTLARDEQLARARLRGENLVFGCSGCNSGVKGCRFPQARTASVLRTHEPPPGEESPLLLDPTDPAEDPIDHIQYRRINKRWIPTWRDGSPRGAWTIALLRLDVSPGLLTAYDARVKHLERCTRRLDDVLAANGSSVRAQWQALCDDVLAPNEALLGLTYDWLDARYPAPLRESRGLSLDKPILRVPGAPAGTTARPAVAPIAALAGLPERLADLIRVARNYQVPTGERLQPSVEHLPLPELLAEILVHRPNASDEELGALLERTPTTIRKNRR